MKRFTIYLVLILFSILLSACSDSDPKRYNDRLTDSEFRTLFADTAIDLWLGEDYTYGGDGTAGIDGAGTVIFTLQEMGYDIPYATSYDMYENIASDTEEIFLYTEELDVTGEDIQSGDYSGLERGDLIFLDYDLDGVYDHVCIFLDSEGDVAVAALTASDYYGEIVIGDLDDDNDPLQQDIVWSSVDVRRLDHASIDEEYVAP